MCVYGLCAVIGHMILLASNDHLQPEELHSRSCNICHWVSYNHLQHRSQKGKDVHIWVKQPAMQNRLHCGNNAALSALPSSQLLSRLLNGTNPAFKAVFPCCWCSGCCMPQAIIVTGALQSFADMALIAGVVIINIAIGLIQEGKAENVAEAIKAMLSSNANMIRDGERKAIEADLVVPGDVVLIKSGDKIPADMRLVNYSNLQVSGMHLALHVQLPPQQQIDAPLPPFSSLPPPPLNGGNLGI